MNKLHHLCKLNFFLHWPSGQMRVPMRVRLRFFFPLKFWMLAALLALAAASAVAAVMTHQSQHALPIVLWCSLFISFFLNRARSLLLAAPLKGSVRLDLAAAATGRSMLRGPAASFLPEKLPLSLWFVAWFLPSSSSSFFLHFLKTRHPAGKWSIHAGHPPGRACPRCGRPWHVAAPRRSQHDIHQWHGHLAGPSTNEMKKKE